MSMQYLATVKQSMQPSDLTHQVTLIAPRCRQRSLVDQQE